MKQEFTYNAKVERVIDGDTVVVNIDLGFGIFTKQTIRLYGIDTPELRSVDSVERSKATEAKDFLQGLIENHEVVIKTTSKDKYGRYLGVIEVNSIEVNQLMLDRNLATVYFGKN